MTSPSTLSSTGPPSRSRLLISRSTFKGMKTRSSSSSWHTRHHRDPFDRLLVAVAHGAGLTLVTADNGIARYDIAQVNACRLVRSELRTKLQQPVAFRTPVRKRWNVRCREGFLCGRVHRTGACLHLVRPRAGPCAREDHSSKRGGEDRRYLVRVAHGRRLVAHVVFHQAGYAA